MILESGIMSPEEEFTCFCYPAHLPGNAYAFNSSGFVFSVNALVPKQLALYRFRIEKFQFFAKY